MVHKKITTKDKDYKNKILNLIEIHKESDPTTWIVEKEMNLLFKGRNKNTFKNYIPDSNNKIRVKIGDINKNSKIRITACCSNCEKLVSISVNKYHCNVERGGFYTCKSCSLIKKDISSLEKHGCLMAEREDTKDKIHNTKLERYGENYAKLNLVKASETMMERYGVPTFLSKGEHRSKVIDGMIEKTGFSHPSYTKEFKDSQYIINQKNHEKWIEKEGIILKDNTFNGMNSMIEIYCHKHDGFYTINKKNYHLRKHQYKVECCTICSPLYQYSGLEGIIHDKLNLLNIPFERNQRKFLDNYEADIFIEDYKTIIEVNGIFFHNLKKKPVYYHRNKRQIAESKGYRLLHIWSDEFDERIDTLLKYSLLPIINEKRIIKNIDKKVANEFHILYNFDGKSTRSNIHLGFFRGDIMVGVVSVLEYKNEYHIQRMSLIERNICPIQDMVNMYIDTKIIFNVLSEKDDSLLFIESGANFVEDIMTRFRANDEFRDEEGDLLCETSGRRIWYFNSNI